MSRSSAPRSIDPFADRIVETIHEPLLVLDEDLRVRRANPSFLRTFQVTEEETVETSLFDLGVGQWEVPELRDALQRVIEEDEAFEGLEIDRTFPDIGRKVMRLNGRPHRREGVRLPEEEP